MAPDYIYVGVLSGEPLDRVKIGHSLDPLKRPRGFKAGNWRGFKVLFTLTGGQPLEAEIHSKFANDKFGDGGVEWFKVTSELLDFLAEKMKETLTVVCVPSDKKFGNGPSQLPTIELGTTELRRTPSVSSVGHIQPHSIVAASRPRNPYARVQNGMSCKATS